jgi:hypothetical protein
MRAGGASAVTCLWGSGKQAPVERSVLGRGDRPPGRITGGSVAEALDNQAAGGAIEVAIAAGPRNAQALTRPSAAMLIRT